MYEALDAIAESMDAQGITGPLLDEARAALAKARGEQP
jgi:hypothetical protein